MAKTNLREQFSRAAMAVGAEVQAMASSAEVVDYISKRLDGPLLLPVSPSLERAGIAGLLEAAGLDLVTGDLRARGAEAAAGLTGSNYGIAATGTVVLESTAEDVRIASTLPEKHFVVLDPAKLLPDAAAGVPLVRQIHERLPQAYLAYLTGPSRTADIERVLTIGVHGPRELHILLLEGISEDPLER